MGSSNTKVKLEELWKSSSEDLASYGVCFSDVNDQVMVYGEGHITSEPGILKGALVIGKQPSEDTLQALNFVESFENSSLEEIKGGLEDIQKNPDSKYKTQCLILLRNLYLIKSKPPVWANEEDFLLLQPAPLETWARALG